MITGCQLPELTMRRLEAAYKIVDAPGAMLRARRACLIPPASGAMNPGTARQARPGSS